MVRVDRDGLFRDGDRLLEAFLAPQLEFDEPLASHGLKRLGPVHGLGAPGEGDRGDEGHDSQTEFHRSPIPFSTRSIRGGELCRDRDA